MIYVHNFHGQAEAVEKNVFIFGVDNSFSVHVHGRDKDKNILVKPCSDERQNGFKLFKTKTK